MGIKNIDQVIRGWVKSNLASGSVNEENRKQRIEIDWHNVRFSTESSWFEEEEEEVPEINIPRMPFHFRIPTFPQPPVPKPPLVFKSNYSNETHDDQIHVFSMKRSTEAKVQTRLTNGFSRDGVVGIRIGVPEEVSSKTGSFGSDIHVGYVDLNAVTHTTTWGINSEVKAVARKKTVAELRVKEENYDCDFGAKVNIRGRVIVKVFDDDTGRMKVIEGDIATVLKNERDRGQFSPDNNVKFRGTKVTWNIGGKLKFNFGVHQCIEVWNEELS